MKYWMARLQMSYEASRIESTHKPTEAKGQLMMKRSLVKIAIVLEKRRRTRMMMMMLVLKA